jgi:hypothetical protein
VGSTATAPPTPSEFERSEKREKEEAQKGNGTGEQGGSSTRLTGEVVAHVGDLPVSRADRAREHERPEGILDLRRGEHRHDATNTAESPSEFRSRPRDQDGETRTTKEEGERPNGM